MPTKQRWHVSKRDVHLARRYATVLQYIPGHHKWPFGKVADHGSIVSHMKRLLRPILVYQNTVPSLQGCRAGKLWGLRKHCYYFLKCHDTWAFKNKDTFTLGLPDVGRLSSMGYSVTLRNLVEHYQSLIPADWVSLWWLADEDSRWEIYAAPLSSSPPPKKYTCAVTVWTGTHPVRLTSC